MSIAALLFPELALITLGWLIRRIDLLPEAFWEGAEKLVYHVLFPALLFGSIARARLSITEAAPMVLAAYAALSSGILASALGRVVIRPDARQFASAVQCGFRFNSYMTLALGSRIGEAPGLALAALITGFVVPVANIAAVIPLARQGGGSAWQAIVRNPLVLATVAGLAAQAVGLRVPEPLDAVLVRLGQASLALGLLCVGASLRLQSALGDEPALRRSAQRLTVWITACKLLVMPLAALLAARALSLAALPTAIVVMYASVPTAPAAFVLANRMGGDGALVAFLITVSTLASLLALPFWLGLL